MAKNKWNPPYKLLEELGEGGNAKVYRILIDGKEFAIKKLSNTSPEKRTRFIEEIDIMLSQSENDGIIPIFEHSKEEYWYIMPVARPIMQYIEKEKPSVLKIVKGVVQIAETLSVLHSQNVAHRDIKPSNIYYYNGKFCLGDFGLVELPDSSEDLTPSDRALGAIFTIAPEMKRNPKTADGKKADVYSLAKTLWMMITSDEKGFEGTYNYQDNCHGLHYDRVPKDLHLVELEEALKMATSNEPDDRPTMKEFSEKLKQWIEITNNFALSQRSDWDFIKKEVFNTNVPEISMWSNRDEIIKILNLITSTPAYNHLLFPDGGGTDLESVETETTGNGIIMRGDLGFLYLVNVKKIWAHCFKESSDWNYFFIESAQQNTPIINEYIVEDMPGHYIAAEDCEFDYGVYDYEKGNPLPQNARMIRKINAGNFLLVFKFGVYNHIGATYDGRHGNVCFDEFSNYMSKLYNTVKYLQSKGVDLEEIVHIPEINKNPFITKTEHNKRDNQENYSSAELTEEIKTSLETWNFIDILSDFENNQTEDTKISFTINISCGYSDLLSHSEQLILKNNGHFEKGKNDVYEITERKSLYEIINRINNKINKILNEKYSIIYEKFPLGLGEDIVKKGAPEHLFSKEEVKQLMQQADDRVRNQLVIDENGYVQLLSGDSVRNSLSYPVRLESWDARNNYVGKYSTLSTLDDNYQMLLEGWNLYCHNGIREIRDYVSNDMSETELVNSIKEKMK